MFSTILILSRVGLLRLVGGNKGSISHSSNIVLEDTRRGRLNYNIIILSLIVN